jgi:chromosome partitioning protein
MGGTPQTNILTIRGVGKTTLAANLGKEMGELENAPVLLVDTDPQCNLTQVFYDSERLDSIHPDRSILATFKTQSRYGDPHAADLRVTVSDSNAAVRIDLIPGSFETLKFGVMQGGLRPDAMMQNFAKFIERCKADYPIIILDTNPSSTFTTLCSLAVADLLIAPVTLDVFSLRGIDLIRDVMSQKYPWLREPERLKILLNRIPRTSDKAKLAKLVEQEKKIREMFPILSPSIMVDRIHETSLLRTSKPGQGFAVLRGDWRYFTRKAVRELKTDLTGAATDLLATVNGRTH